MFAAYLESLVSIFTMPSLLYMLVGCSLGFICGIVPGISGSIGMAILIPVTFGMPPDQAIVLLVCTYGAASTAGSVTAILINVPGTSENAATIFDGYPMAQQGRAGEAIAASAMGGTIGIILGLVFFALMVPVVKPIVLAFGPPEFFMLAVFGLAAIASLSKNNVLKGLIGVGIGIVIAFHGTNPITGSIRFDFGFLYLWEGVTLLPAIIGLFGICEVVSLLVSDQKIAKGGVLIKGGMIKGFVAVFKEWKLIMVSSIIGWFVGVVPGVGGSVSSFLAYAHAVQTAKPGETFGTGNVKGVMAPETANNCKDGGALLPSLMMGIPGSTGTAILITALIFHGIAPGRVLITEYPTIVAGIVLCLAISNTYSCIVALSAGPILTRLTIISPSTMAPIILVTCCVGAYSIRNSLNDVVLAGLLGVVGYFLQKCKFPKIGLLMALLLTPLAERSLHTSLQISNGSYWILFSRPFSLVFFLLAIFSLIWPYVKDKRKKGKTDTKILPM